MPKLVRLYIVNVAVGFALGAAFVGLLLVLDVGGLRGLILATEGGRLGGILLVTFNGLVFAGAQFGIAVMALAESDGSGPPPGRAERSGAAPVPLAIPVEHRSGGRGASDRLSRQP